MEGDLQEITDRQPWAHGIRLIAFLIREALADLHDGQAFEQGPINDEAQKRDQDQSSGIEGCFALIERDAADKVTDTDGDNRNSQGRQPEIDLYQAQGKNKAQRSPGRFGGIILDVG